SSFTLLALVWAKRQDVNPNFKINAQLPIYLLLNLTINEPQVRYSSLVIRAYTIKPLCTLGSDAIELIYCPPDFWEDQWTYHLY
ncbi:hypothetical protein, partial [Shewanella japonica]|uniref:hypothetical protein n=1 Tax=Shewanella japonica TaxID=93973 RepID=UPI0024949A9B